jgi:hypothetical protein
MVEAEPGENLQENSIGASSKGMPHTTMIMPLFSIY